VLDRLQTDDCVVRAVGERQRDQVAAYERERGVRPADVRDRVLVVVQRDDAAGLLGEKLRTVALAAPGLEDDRVAQLARDRDVDALVPPEPIILVPDTRQRSLASYRQRCTLTWGDIQNSDLLAIFRVRTAFTVLIT
jgi:hypothetical protein